MDKITNNEQQNTSNTKFDATFEDVVKFFQDLKAGTDSVVITDSDNSISDEKLALMEASINLLNIDDAHKKEYGRILVQNGLNFQDVEKNIKLWGQQALKLLLSLGKKSESAENIWEQAEKFSFLLNNKKILDSAINNPINSWPPSISELSYLYKKLYKDKESTTKLPNLYMKLERATYVSDHDNQFFATIPSTLLQYEQQYGIDHPIFTNFINKYIPDQHNTPIVAKNANSTADATSKMYNDNMDNMDLIRKKLGPLKSSVDTNSILSTFGLTAAGIGLSTLVGTAVLAVSFIPIFIIIPPVGVVIGAILGVTGAVGVGATIIGASAFAISELVYKKQANNLSSEIAQHVRAQAEYQKQQRSELENTKQKPALNSDLSNRIGVHLEQRSEINSQTIDPIPSAPQLVHNFEAKTSRLNNAQDEHSQLYKKDLSPDPKTPKNEHEKESTTTKLKTK
jgi:hypothetical protein